MKKYLKEGISIQNFLITEEAFDYIQKEAMYLLKKELIKASFIKVFKGCFSFK